MFAAVWPGIRTKMYEAASGGARLIVLPEGTIPAYVLGDLSLDEDANRQALADCKVVASETRTTLVIGAVRRVRSCLVNSASVIDSDGSVAGWADKQFLWHFDSQWFSPGDSLRPISTSLGSIGALVCADGRIPTIAQTLVARGAQVLVMPTAWVTSGRDPSMLENVQADLLARVRAQENGVPFVAANKCGAEIGAVAYCGKSQIIDADGNVLALASQHDAEIIYADIDVQEPRETQEAVRLEASAGDPIAAARIAVTADAFDASSLSTTLRIVEADFAIAPDATCSANGDRVAIARAGDDTFLDPRGLVDFRRGGGILAVWDAGSRRIERAHFARARALELRMYVVVIDRPGKRAYAIDPDGTVVCGTFGDFRIAAFVFDPLKAHATLVAPHTDVLEGLARAAESAKA